MTLARILRVAALSAVVTSGWLAGCSSSSSGGCSTSADCGGDQNSCYGDYSPSCVCETSPACTTDADCMGGTVCDPARSLFRCGAVALGCQAACTTDTECAAWQSCTSKGHCEARTCDECPTYLSCPAGGSGGPKECSSSDECPGGNCVNGECQATLGKCGIACV
jgi:hypothetical protein